MPYSFPGEARAIVFEAAGKAVIAMSPLPMLGPEDLAIEATLSLVSAGTERGLLMHAPAYPILPGYSLVGKVAAVGERVSDFRVGDRVVATIPHASHVVVHQSLAARIPDAVTDEHASFFNIGAMAIHALRLGEIELGDPVLILGQGLIGLLTSQIARQAGAVPVIGVDIDRSRLDKARTMGADLTFHADEDRNALIAALQTLPGKGPAVAIELSGSSTPIDLAIEVTRRQGRIVAASVVPGGYNVDLYGRVFLEGLKLVGSYFNARPFQLRATETTSPYDWPVRPFDGGVYDGNRIATSAGDVMLFLRLAALGRLELDAMLDEEVPAEAAPAMFEQLPHSHSLGRLIRWR